VRHTAKNEPLRYGKHGELLIDYENTEEHAVNARRASNFTGGEEKPVIEHMGGSLMESEKDEQSGEGV